VGAMLRAVRGWAGEAHSLAGEGGILRQEAIPAPSQGVEHSELSGSKGIRNQKLSH
jgi:hypothetical protein